MQDNYHADQKCKRNDKTERDVEFNRKRYYYPGKKRQQNTKKRKLVPDFHIKEATNVFLGQTYLLLKHLYNNI